MRGIYKIVNRDNGKYYVGSSTDIHERWNEHRRSLREGTHTNPKLQASWNVHTEEKFEFIVVEPVEASGRKALMEAEQKYLDIAKSEPSSTYNIKFVANGWDWDGEHLMKSIRRGAKHRNYSTVVYTFTHLNTGEVFTGTKCDFYTRYGLDKSSVRRVVNGTFKTVNGWALVGT